MPDASPPRDADLEIERKFLVATPPRDLGGYDHAPIDQGYLTPPTADTSVRLRRYGTRYLLTAKQGAGLRRREAEVEISEAQFEALWPLTHGRRLAKVRYRIPHGAHTIDLDVYAGPLAGLVTAEVEFSDEASAAAYRPPAWFGPDVTDDVRYTNAQLAAHGSPAGR